MTRPEPITVQNTLFAMSDGKKTGVKFVLTLANVIAEQIQENWPSVLLALASGVILSMGNLSAQYAWALVGLSVTEVVSCSISVTIGLCSLSFPLQAKFGQCLQLEESALTLLNIWHFRDYYELFP